MNDHAVLLGGRQTDSRAHFCGANELRRLRDVLQKDSGARYKLGPSNDQGGVTDVEVGWFNARRGWGWILKIDGCIGEPGGVGHAGCSHCNGGRVGQHGWRCVEPRSRNGAKGRVTTRNSIHRPGDIGVCGACHCSGELSGGIQRNVCRCWRDGDSLRGDGQGEREDQ